MGFLLKSSNMISFNPFQPKSMKHAFSILKIRKSVLLIFILILILAFNTTKELTTLSQVEEVTIGEQVWMKCNLNVDRFQNGDLIPEAKSKKEWQKANESKQPAWCYYDNNPADADKKGKLYNWYAVSDQRGLAPAGWRIPGLKDWTILLSNSDNRFEMGKRLLSDSSFSALYVGYRAGPSKSNYYNYSFHNGGKATIWWSMGDSDTFDEARGVIFDNIALQGSFHHHMGLSVRCIK